MVAISLRDSTAVSHREASCVTRRTPSDLASSSLSQIPTAADHGLHARQRSDAGGAAVDVQPLQQHCPTHEGLAIPHSRMQQLQQQDAELKAISLPMPAGSALLMTHRTIHKSLDNVTSSDVRVSLDLRYQIAVWVAQLHSTPASFIARSLLRNQRAKLKGAEEWGQEVVQAKGTNSPN